MRQYGLQGRHAPSAHQAAISRGHAPLPVKHPDAALCARARPSFVQLSTAQDPPQQRSCAAQLPTQGDAVVAGVDPVDYINKQLQDILKPPSDVDYLAVSVEHVPAARLAVAALRPEAHSAAALEFLPQEFLAIQNNGPRTLGFFGTRNMGFMHQQLIEVLSYAMVITGNHIFTSGATGTNAAVIRGALRAEQPELLTVVLPQSLQRQPTESQDLLQQVKNIITMPENDELQLLEASRICNRNIIGRVQQVICFAFHDSRLLLETCQEARDENKIVTLFYLD